MNSLAKAKINYTNSYFPAHSFSTTLRGRSPANPMKFLAILLFTIVALLAFSVWAFGGALFPSQPTMYAGCAVVFLGFGGPALLPGSGIERGRRLRFCLAFATAFVVYAFLWSAAWFALASTFGEILGSSLGLLAFVALLRGLMKWSFPLLTGVAVVFLWHTLGYYLGGFAYASLQDRGPLPLSLAMDRDSVVLLARMSWGLAYGAGLGLGITQLTHLSRQT